MAIKTFITMCHVMKRIDVSLWSLEIEKCNVTLCRGTVFTAWYFCYTWCCNYCAVMDPVFMKSKSVSVTLDIKKKINLSACHTMRDSIYVCFHTFFMLCINCVSSIFLPRCPQCTQCSGVKYNVDEPFKANAIWKAGKGEGTQLSAKHVFFKGCP